MKNFWACFVPIFFAVDAFGVLPMFLGFTEDMDVKRVNRIIFQSVITASVVALAFLAVGIAVFKLLGITIADFLVAGGILLFVISLSDLITTEKIQRRTDPESMGAVPLGVPLITGPAVLTTSILLVNDHGLVMISAAILLNVLIAGIIFFFARGIHRFLGKAGAKTISKIASLLLAAIGVMMIRKGIATFIALH
ncbi:MarC family protein [bacterium]|nr:MarC family protein [bacterium]